MEIGIDSFKIIVLLFVGIHSFSFSLPQFDRVFSISSSTFASFLRGDIFRCRFQNLVMGSSSINVLVC